MWITLLIILYLHKVWCKAIEWSWVTPSATYIVFHLMIDVMIGVNNEPCCWLPAVPTSFSKTCPQYKASLVNANICWSRLFSREDGLQEAKNVCGWFCFRKFGPCNDNTTWCTDSLNTIKSWSFEVVGVWLRGCYSTLVMGWCRLRKMR